MTNPPPFACQLATPHTPHTVGMSLDSQPPLRPCRSFPRNAPRVYLHIGNAIGWHHGARVSVRTAHGWLSRTVLLLAPALLGQERGAKGPGTPVVARVERSVQHCGKLQQGFTCVADLTCDGSPRSRQLQGRCRESLGFGNDSSLYGPRLPHVSVRGPCPSFLSPSRSAARPASSWEMAD